MAGISNYCSLVPLSHFFRHDHVIKPLIANNNMIGNVPSEIEFFPYLDTWITPFNADLTTTSSLDPFIKLSGSLTHLELQYCKISGAIPDTMGSMSALSFLGLGEYREFRRRKL